MQREKLEKVITPGVDQAKLKKILDYREEFLTLLDKTEDKSIQASIYKMLYSLYTHYSKITKNLKNSITYNQIDNWLNLQKGTAKYIEYRAMLIIKHPKNRKKLDNLFDALLDNDKKDIPWG
jgi:hypothetical protein